MLFCTPPIIAARRTHNAAELDKWCAWAGFAARPHMAPAMAVLATSPEAASPGLGYSFRSEGSCCAHVRCA